MENYYLGVFPPPKTKPCYRSFYIIKYSSAKQKLITTIWKEANYQILHMLDHNYECTREREAIMNKSLFGSKLTWSNGGWGFPLQRLDRVQAAFTSIESLAPSFNCNSKEGRGPCPRTISRHLGESPDIFPNAQTTWYSKNTAYLQLKSGRRTKNSTKHIKPTSIFSLNLYPLFNNKI